MILVHKDVEQEYLDKGYIPVETTKLGNHWLCHPDDYCLRKMRGGKYCTMEKAHRGRCSSVTFYCDACGKQRRGQAHRQEFDINGDLLVQFCWMCVDGPYYRAPWE